jgi:hypothetical protein
MALQGEMFNNPVCMNTVDISDVADLHNDK